MTNIKVNLFQQVLKQLNLGLNGNQEPDNSIRISTNCAFSEGARADLIVSHPSTPVHVSPAASSSHSMKAATSGRSRLSGGQTMW